MAKDGVGAEPAATGLQESGSRLRQLHKAARLAFPQRQAMAVILALVLTAAGINAFEPLVLKALFDGLTGAAGYETVLVSLVILASLAVGREALDGFANWLTWRTRIGLRTR